MEDILKVGAKSLIELNLSFHIEMSLDIVKRAISSGQSNIVGFVLDLAHANY